MTTDLFPIRLKPFEELFYIDDNSENPATAFCLVTFNKSIDIDAANTALVQTCKRHPMMNSKIHEDRHGNLFFVERLTSPRVILATQPWDHTFDKVAIDPQRGPLLRVTYFPETFAGKMLFQVHHCATDGIGAGQFFRDWLQAYRSVCLNDESPKLRSLEPVQLLDRCTSKLTWMQNLKTFARQWHSIKAVFKFRRRKIVPLLPIRDLKQNIDSAPTLSMSSLQFSSESTQCLRSEAEIAGITVNSMLLAKLFAALRDFHCKKNSSLDGAYWRIAVPVNERTIAHRRLPACNHCTTIFLDRSLDEILDEVSLAKGIHNQVNFIRQWKLSQNMWRYLAFLRKFGGLKKQLQRENEKCSATVVFSNLGDVTPKSDRSQQPNGIHVVRMEPTGPLRHGTPLTISAFYFQQQLELVFRHNPDQLPNHDLQRLISIFRRSIQRSIPELEIRSNDTYTAEHSGTTAPFADVIQH